MAGNDADELGWADDPLVRALRAPGSAEELADEQDFVAAFHAARPRGRAVRRLVGRIGLGATTALATVAFTGGMAAAAYTRVLPEPVQDFAHSVFGPVGVPGRHHERHDRQATRTPTPNPASTLGVTLGVTPSTRPTHGPGPLGHPTGTATPGGRPSPRGPAPGTATTPSGPSPTTGSGTPVRVPAAVTATTPDSEVPVATSVPVSGVVTDAAGHRLRNRVVRLAARPAGGTWSVMARGTTDARGQVTVDSAPLQVNTRLRLVVKGVTSAPVRVVVDPVLTATASAAGGSTTITITATGGRPGDTVTAYRRQGTALVSVGSVRLDASGSATITVPTPRRGVRVLLRLPATGQHAKAQTTVLIGP